MYSKLDPLIVTSETLAYWQSFTVVITKLVYCYTPPKLTPVSTAGMARLPRQLSHVSIFKVLVVLVKLKYDGDAPSMLREYLIVQKARDVTIAVRA